MVNSDNLRRAQSNAKKYDPQLGIFIRSTYDQAETNSSGPLSEILLGVKDIIFESSGPTTAQSLVALASWPTQQKEGTALHRLKSAGATVVGKTATMEYALGLPEEGGIGPISKNPWDKQRWAGGSSSGSGSGIITECFTAALATDTTGSLRIPAAYTGTTGMKPTKGLVPTDGIYPLAPSLDTVGPLARDAKTCARLLSIMAGDSRLMSQLDEMPGSLRIAVADLNEYADGGIDPSQPKVFATAISTISRIVKSVESIAIPNYSLMNVVGNILMLAEAHEIHYDHLQSDWSSYGRGARWVFSAADQLHARDYIHAQRLKRRLQGDIESLFEKADLVVTPTCHLVAPQLDSMHPLDPSTYLGSMHTTAWSVTGHPVAVVPIGLNKTGLPLSMSIIGPIGADHLVLQLAHAYQQHTDHHIRSFIPNPE